MPRPGNLVGGSVVVCCLLAARAGVFTGFEPADVEVTSALAYAAVGAAVGGLVGVALLRRPSAGSARSSKELRSAARIMAVALGAVAALTLAPRSAPKPPAESVSRRAPSAIIDLATREVQYDGDGNGTFEQLLVACPGRPETEVHFEELHEFDTIDLKVDDGCNGTIDAVVRAQVINSTLGPPSTLSPFNSRDELSDVGSGFMGVIIGFGLACLIAIMLTYRRRVVVRRDRRAGRAGAPTLTGPGDDDVVVDDEAAAQSFADSARLLLDDPDPRRAVIAAYGELLDGLHAAGVGRLAHEAPEEHLRRALSTLRIPADSARVVTELFLVARFSTHPIGEDDRRRAVRALNDAEVHLRSRVGAT